MTGARRPLFAESEEALHEQARSEVGWDDFGDPGYLEAATHTPGGRPRREAPFATAGA